MPELTEAQRKLLAQMTLVCFVDDPPHLPISADEIPLASALQETGLLRIEQSPPVVVGNIEYAPAKYYVSPGPVYEAFLLSQFGLEAYQGEMDKDMNIRLGLPSLQD